MYYFIMLVIFLAAPAPDFFFGSDQDPVFLICPWIRLGLTCIRRTVPCNDLEEEQLNRAVGPKSTVPFNDRYIKVILLYVKCLEFCRRKFSKFSLDKKFLWLAFNDSWVNSFYFHLRTKIIFLDFFRIK